MIRTDKTDSVPSHHSELVDVPVGEVRLVQDRHLLVAMMKKAMKVTKVTKVTMVTISKIAIWTMLVNIATWMSP